MTKNKRIIVVSMCILAVTAIAVIVQAVPNRVTVINNYPPPLQHQPQKHPFFSNMSSSHHLNHQIREIARIFNLTTDQETQVQTIVTNERLAAQPIKQKIAADRNQLAANVTVVPYDEAAVSALATQLGADISNLLVMEVQAKNQIYALLTP